MAHELDELIPIMDMHFALCYHRILFTHIPGNHDASEAYPSCGCSQKKGKKRKIGKLVSTERKKNGKEKKSPQGPEARKPRSSWRNALEPFTFRIRISRYPDDLAETYAERKISQKLSKKVFVAVAKLED